MEEEQSMIIIQDDFRVKVSTSGTEELFDLKQNPDETSLFVQEVKRKLKSSLDLQVVVDHLYNTADLLCISYNVLEGTMVKPLVSGLQVDLAYLCGKSQIAMVEINHNTGQMLKILPMVYTMLVKGKVKEALKLLAKASSTAGNIARATDGLANQVDGMIENAKTALSCSEGLYAQEVQKKADFARKLEDIQAEKESLSQYVEEMRGIIEELQIAYIEVKQKEEKTEKRAFTMEMISSLTGLADRGIGEMISSLTPKQGEYSKALERTMELQKQKLEMQKGKIELKGDLTKVAYQVKEQVNENMTFDIAIKTLPLALQCLGQMVVALQTTAIFWRGIESGYKSLTQDTLITFVDGLQETDEQFQSEMYLQDSFTGQMLSYMSTWVALGIISREYAEASFKAGETVRFNVTHPKFGNDAYSTARQLADDILSRME